MSILYKVKKGVTNIKRGSIVRKLECQDGGVLVELVEGEFYGRSGYILVPEKKLNIIKDNN